MKRILGIGLVLFTLGVGGCNSSSTPEPQIASSSGQPGYASRYPEQLKATSTHMSEAESQTRERLGKFAFYPDELDKPDWNVVEQVVDAADQAGRSGGYVERRREVGGVAEFFEAEKAEISKKVAGAANYAANQKGCKVEVYGPASSALEKSVEKQLEKRLRERNPAHSIIEDNQDAIGTANKEKLEKQADDIAEASYLTHIAVVEDKVRLKAMVDEANDVKSTLDKTIEDASKVMGDTNRSDKDKKAAEGRKAAAEKAKAEVDQQVQATQEELKTVDDRIKKLKDDYDQAFSALKQAIESRKSTPAS